MDQIVYPFGDPLRSPVTPEDSLEQCRHSLGVSSGTADNTVSVEAQGPAPEQAMVSSPFSINPVLASDKKLWDL